MSALEGCGNCENGVKTGGNMHFATTEAGKLEEACPYCAYCPAGRAERARRGHPPGWDAGPSPKEQLEAMTARAEQAEKERDEAREETRKERLCYNAALAELEAAESRLAEVEAQAAAMRNLSDAVKAYSYAALFGEETKGARECYAEMVRINDAVRSDGDAGRAILVELTKLRAVRDAADGFVEDFRARDRLASCGDLVAALEAAKAKT